MAASKPTSWLSEQFHILSPTSSLGPQVSFWTYLQTVNVLNTSEQRVYTAPLFVIEVSCKYEFASYKPKPELGKLLSQEFDKTDSSQVTLTNTSDGAVAMTVSGGLARTLDSTERSGQTSGVGETLWTIAGAATEGAAAALGPWGWLIRGGWWVIRKLFGRAARDATSTYLIYPSVEDADKDNRIYQQVAQSSGAPHLGVSRFEVHQLTAANTNSDAVGFSGADIQPYLPLREAEPYITPSFIYTTNDVPVTPSRKFDLAVIALGGYARWSGTSSGRGMLKYPWTSTWSPTVTKNEFWVFDLSAAPFVTFKYDSDYNLMNQGVVNTGNTILAVLEKLHELEQTPTWLHYATKTNFSAPAEIISYIDWEEEDDAYIWPTWEMTQTTEPNDTKAYPVIFNLTKREVHVIYFDPNQTNITQTFYPWVFGYTAGQPAWLDRRPYFQESDISPPNSNTDFEILSDEDQAPPQLPRPRRVGTRVQQL